MIFSAFQPRGLAEHHVVAMVTSQLSGLAFPGDTLLVKWSEAGLPKPSLVRLAKVVTVDGSLIRRKLGMLPESDRKVIGDNSGSCSRNLSEGGPTRHYELVCKNHVIDVVSISEPRICKLR